MLIGLHGKKQAGKDTVYERAAHILADVFTVQRVSFADLLYESAAAALGVTVEQLREWKADPAVRVQVVRLTEGETLRDDGQDDYGFCEDVLVEQTIREFLQRYGTEAHRDIFGLDFWVEHVRLLHERRLLIVTDVRFENEARAVARAGGYVARVVGPDEVENAGDGHASEAGLSDELIDLTIYNRIRDDGFRLLDAQINTIVRDLFRRHA